MSRKLENKVAVITGGNSGMGLATAKLFAQEGAKVAITGRNAATLETALAEIGHGAIGQVSDVSAVSSFEPMYAEVSSRLGKIDVLIVNAGVALPSPLGDTTEELFDQISDVNFKGAFFTIQKALPFLNDGAAIVITATNVAEKGVPGVAVYSATKAAVRSLVRVFAAELAGRQIRVNTLSPGSVKTPILEKAGFSPEMIAGTYAHFTNWAALKRVGTVEEMAKGFLFLATDDSSFMTGGDLVLDGGIRDL